MDQEPVFILVPESSEAERIVKSDKNSRYHKTFGDTKSLAFKPPETHMESIGALMESAGATVEGFRQQTRAGLEFALEEHKTVNAKLDLQATLIIIPESCTEKNTNVLILDAGHVSLTSDLVKRSDVGEIQSKQSQQYNEEDWKRLESLMYDKFRLTLESTQVSLLHFNVVLILADYRYKRFLSALRSKKPSLSCTRIRIRSSITLSTEST